MIVGRDKEKNFSIFQNYGFPVEKLVWYEDFIETHEYLTPYLQRERFFARQKMGGSEKAHGLQLKTFNNEILNELEQNPENSQISNVFQFILLNQLFPIFLKIFPIFLKFLDFCD